jgi:hypothetical protein
MRILAPLIILDANLTSSNVTEDVVYAAYNAGTTYGVGNIIYYSTTNSHRRYVSLQASNIGNTPLTSPLWWQDEGADTKWSMFDGSVQSQSTNANTVDVVVVPPGRVNCIAILNMSCASFEVKITDSIAGLVYDQVFNGVSTAGIVDEYHYFFDPITRLSDIVLLDLPNLNAPSIEIIFTDTGNTVGVGCVLFGQSVTIGATQYGASVGIQDYSIKTQDTFGNYSITQRAYSKTGSFTVFVDNILIDSLQSKLASYRAIPTLYIGSDGYTSTLIYGYYKDFSIAISYVYNSVCTLDIEGLT